MSDDKYYQEIALANAIERVFGIMEDGTKEDCCREDCYWYAEEQDMNARIPYCECKSKFPIGQEDCKHCELYHSKNKKTNADRIRSMTDEELAEFLDRWALGDIDYSKTFCDLCEGQYDCHDDCLMDWLKEKVKE